MTFCEFNRLKTRELFSKRAINAESLRILRRHIVRYMAECTEMADHINLGEIYVPLMS